MPASTSNLAIIREFKERGALIEARNLLSALLDGHPDHIEANKLCAEIYFTLGRREEGFYFAMHAYELDGTDIEYGLDCAFNLVRAGRRNDALRIAEMISAQSLGNPHHRDALGTILTYCEVPEKAVIHFERACALIPDSPEFLYNLASAQRMVGAIDKAEDNLDLAIRLNPVFGASYLARSALRRQTLEKNHVEELEMALSGARDVESKISIGYALAKEQEDLGQYRQSFTSLATASRLQRSRTVYDADSEIGLMRRLGELDYSSFSSSQKPRDERGMQPIFVMGLPRSGTTLIDRIIASVPGVVSAGETNVLAAELWRVATRTGRPANPHATVVEAIRQSASQIGANYLKSFQGRFEGNFIDKTPGNFLFAGLIKATLPGARMICLRRNPMDNCYAMFKTLFSGTYPFSYHLSELAEYYKEWDRLVRRWENSLGDAWLTVHYEDIIRIPQSTMRRIVAHCGLSWTDDCLRFHELSAPVTSASAGQVNRPLHGESIGLWRNYAAELNELAERLREAGIEIDQSPMLNANYLPTLSSQSCAASWER
jgi:tetratricopeptide (TPR) repeat protein